MREVTNSKSVGAHFHCLVLEDDQVCAHIIARIVREQGGEVVVCPSLESARKAIDEQRFDLLIFDHELPDGTGTSFFYELRQQEDLTTVIMLTGVPNLHKAVQMTRSGLFDYLTKPIDLPAFLDTLQRAILHLSQPEPDFASLDFFGQSPVMDKVRRLMQHAAGHPTATVLLNGETGTGKDLGARVIHQLTFAREATPPPFVNVNCSTLPGEMFEAELFGAEKGAYTGAHQQRRGLVESAHGGTLFLDEIAEVPISLQAKLLQLLETREFRRLGSTETRFFEGRIIAATNKSLVDEVEAGRFREDLMYRIDVFTIYLPALRERGEDLAGLSELVLDRLSSKYSRSKPIIRPDDMRMLRSYHFPGNVRELRNLLERSLLQTEPESNWLELDRQFLRRRTVQSHAPSRSIAVPVPMAEPALANPSPEEPEPVLPPDRKLSSIEAQEYTLIQRTLQEENGVIRRAASRLGLTHQSLIRRLKKWPELHPSH